jgi:hypothetical protein
MTVNFPVILLPIPLPVLSVTAFFTACKHANIREYVIISINVTLSYLMGCFWHVFNLW